MRKRLHIRKYKKMYFYLIYAVKSKYFCSVKICVIILKDNIVLTLVYFSA